MRYLDKSARKFLQASVLIILLFLTAITFFICFYVFSTLNTYNYILLFLTGLTIISTLLVVSSVTAILYTYTTKKTNCVLLWLTNFGLKALMPSIIHISGILKGSKDTLRRLYIELNNTLVLQSSQNKYQPEDILLILPHCLQNSKCTYKITGDISNCGRCGKCSVGNIAKVADDVGITVKVVTGGTAARNIVTEKKPGIILSVACERDLTSGISDITGIPVLGIVNDRPFGPCCNTSVDVDVLRKRLFSILKK